MNALTQIKIDEAVLTRRQSIIGRIMDRVLIDAQTSCWVWQGPTSGEGRGGGYGRMSLNGQTVATHIVSFTHFHGYVPSKKQVDHTCRNRLCCNPEHLELVSHKTNQKRRAKAGKFKTRADLMAMSEFADLQTDTSGNPCVWENQYVCCAPSCNDREGWDDQWSSKCSGSCPTCGYEVEPFQSDWIGPSEAGLVTLWRELPEAE